MYPDTEHLEEICQNIKKQYETGAADLALFEMPLNPEGNPVIDKAEILLEKYDLFKKRLDELGCECGILVQSTIGHGVYVDEMFPYAQYTNLTDGEKQPTCCPYDEGLREYLKSAMKKLAARHPKMIMIDDDFRLMLRPGKACACERHMAEFNKRAGTELTREELYEFLKGDFEESPRYRDIFVETQKESLIGAAKAIREGIDEIDPTIQGAICMAGKDCEFAEEEAEIIAGKGNPSIARLNNGTYHPETGAHYFTVAMIRAATQVSKLKNKIDVFLAETDTCPQNRYSTGAQFLHAHFTGTILEGASGAKHWITKLDNYEEDTGEAYRKILEKNKMFYETLQSIVPDLKPIGCNIPLAHDRTYYFQQENIWSIGNDHCWASRALERMGLPLYFTDQYGGAVFMSGGAEDKFSDEELTEYLKGTVVLASDSLKGLNERGFLKYTGVECEEWTGENISGELVGNGRCAPQKNAKKLVLRDGAKADSYCYHLKDGKEKQPIFPGVAVFENEFGGTVISFCGTPDTWYHYTEAFSLLCKTRKNQLVRLLGETGNLDVYYPGDAEIYMRAGYTKDNGLMCALFNLSYDCLEDIPLCCDKEIKNVKYLDKDGKIKQCEFEKCGNGVVVKAELRPLDPAVFFIEK